MVKTSDLLTSKYNQVNLVKWYTKITYYLYWLTESGAGPHKSEWTSSKGEFATNLEVPNGNLCISSCKQWVQDCEILVHLFANGSKEDKAKLRTWLLGWPSLLCQSWSKEFWEATLLQTLGKRLRFWALFG